MEALKTYLRPLQWYVVWNFHEPRPGVFKWDGFADVEHFLKLCSELDLMVLFRPGPYACAEWEFGGLPWWLASKSVGLLSSATLSLHPPSAVWGGFQLQ